jgi:hypothetical protein
MKRFAIPAVVFSLSLVCSVASAQTPKYPVPPHPALGIKKCVIVFDSGSPSAAWNAGATALNVTANGKYNYDNTWTFEKLEVYLRYINPDTGASRDGPYYSVTDETTLAAPGSFAVTFNNVAEPQMGEQLHAYIRIIVKKQGQADEIDSKAAQVAIPAKPPED